MASYIELTLTDDERILYTGHISLWSLWHLLFFGVICLPFFGAGLILLLMALVRYKSTEIAITNKRTIAKFGFISRSTIELNIGKVESIQVQQTVMGRIFDFGTLILAGAGNPQEPIIGISKPMEFRKAFAIAQENSARLNSGGAIPAT